MVPFFWQAKGTYTGDLAFFNIKERWGNPKDGCDNIISEKSGECIRNDGPTAPTYKDISDPNVLELQ